MMLQWDDLPVDHKTALRRMNRGPYSELSDKLGRELIELGLAEMRSTGIGISRAGRELVMKSLLRVRQT